MSEVYRTITKMVNFKNHLVGNISISKLDEVKYYLEQQSDVPSQECYSIAKYLNLPNYHKVTNLDDIQVGIKILAESISGILCNYESEFDIKILDHFREYGVLTFRGKAIKPVELASLLGVSLRELYASPSALMITDPNDGEMYFMFHWEKLHEIKTDIMNNIGGGSHGRSGHTKSR